MTAAGHGASQAADAAEAIRIDDLHKSFGPNEVLKGRMSLPGSEKALVAAQALARTRCSRASACRWPRTR